MATQDPAKRAEQNRRYYEKNPEVYRLRAVAQRARNLAHVVAAKDKPCLDCGNRYPHYVMDFDHVRGEKIGDVSALMRNASIAKIDAEIAKCDLVCSNCHRERTWERLRVVADDV